MEIARKVTNNFSTVASQWDHDSWFIVGSTTASSMYVYIIDVMTSKIFNVS